MDRSFWSRAAPRQIAGAAILAVSALVMLAWKLRIDWLLTIIDGAAPMQFNTALMFAACSVDMLLPSSRRLVHRAIPSMVITFSMATLLQDLAHYKAGIDQLFMAHHVTNQSPSPGRMAPNTAICFVNYGIHRFRPHGDYVWIGLALSLSAVAGYKAGWDWLYRWSDDVTAMAIHTAVAFVMMFASTAFVEPGTSGYEL